MNNYVYDNVEVLLTGRVAIKQIKMTNKIVEDRLIEIKPADPEGPTWKKWVRSNELYQIQENST